MKIVQLQILLQFFGVPKKDVGGKRKSKLVRHFKEIAADGRKPMTYDWWTDADELELTCLIEDDIKLEDTALGRSKEKKRKLEMELEEREAKKNKKELDRLIQILVNEGRGSNFMESMKAQAKEILDEMYQESKMAISEMHKAPVEENEIKQPIKQPIFG